MRSILTGMQISKSDFMLWRKQPAWLWLKKNDPDKLPPVDAATQAIFDTGHDFEHFAEAQYPNGVQLGFDGYDEYRTLPERTAKALGAGAVTIFQGRFELGELTFICDIVDVVDAESKTVDLFEIKSSTKAKPEHIIDLAFQTIVLKGLGYVVRNIAVIHVNKQFVRNGDIVPADITATTEVTNEVSEAMPTTKDEIEQALATAKLVEAPDLSPALASKDGFTDWLDVYKTIRPQEPGSIFELCGLNPKLIGEFEEKGITRIVDIPNDFPLSRKQRLQVEATKSGAPIIDVEKIQEFMAGLQYPLYFLDYETMSSLVPYFDGLKPYQQLPTQYSLHVLPTPGGKLEHMEYIHTDNSNPALPLTEQLLKDIGDSGTVLVWYEGFEKARNSELAELLPQHADGLRAINDRIVDLMLPFKNLWFVDGKFKGSASIKNVYPALVPDGKSYKELDIQEGETAQRLWMETVLYGKNPDQKDKILENLIEYCRLDTLAMVEIYKVLRGL